MSIRLDGLKTTFWILTIAILTLSILTDQYFSMLTDSFCVSDKCYKLKCQKKKDATFPVKKPPVFLIIISCICNHIILCKTLHTDFFDHMIIAKWNRIYNSHIKRHIWYVTHVSKVSMCCDLSACVHMLGILFYDNEGFYFWELMILSMFTLCILFIVPGKIVELTVVLCSFNT